MSKVNVWYGPVTRWSAGRAEQPVEQNGSGVTESVTSGLADSTEAGKRSDLAEPLAKLAVPIDETTEMV